MNTSVTLPAVYLDHPLGQSYADKSDGWGVYELQAYNKKQIQIPTSSDRCTHYSAHDKRKVMTGVNGLNPEHYTDLYTAYDRLCYFREQTKHLKSVGPLGLGFNPTGLKLACADLDVKHILDPAVLHATRERHIDIIRQFHSYCEVSPSRGWHVWIELDSLEGLIIGRKQLPNRHIDLFVSSPWLTVNLDEGKDMRSDDWPIINRHALFLELFPEVIASVPRTAANGRIPAASEATEGPHGGVVDDSWMRCPWNGKQGWQLPSEAEMEERCAPVVSAIQSHRTLGPKFDKLCTERFMAEYASYSDADQALVNIVSLFTDDKFLVACIWQHSPLGRREHAPTGTDRGKHRKDRKYIPRTVNKAWNERRGGLRQRVLNTIPVWGARPTVPAGADAPAPASASCPAPGPAIGVASSNAPRGGRIDTPEPQELLADSDLRPPGLLGGIADYIYQVAYLPNRYVALAGAIAMLAGIAGRAFNTSTGTGLNQYLILLGRSGIGKEAAAHGASRLCAALQSLAAKDVIYGYMGPAGIASPQALMRHLPIQPSLWSNLGEIGFWLQKLNSPNANPNEVQLKRLLLDVYHKSGQTDVLNGAIYADASKDTPAVHAPAFTFLGDSTLVEFYKSIDENNVHEGLVSRFTVFECPDVCPVYNPNAADQIPADSMRQELERLVCRSCYINQDVSRVVRVDETPEAKTFQLDYQRVCQKREWEDRSKPELQIWNRAHLRMLRLGSLAAVACSPDSDRPMVEVEHYQWARKVIEHGVETVLRRFQSGDVGNTTLGFQQRKELGEILREYAHSEWTQKLGSSYRITQEMHKHKGVPRSYLQQRLINTSPFAKDPHDANLALNRAFEHFIQAEVLSEWQEELIEGNNPRRKAIVYRILDVAKLR